MVIGTKEQIEAAKAKPKLTKAEEELVKAEQETVFRQKKLDSAITGDKFS